MVIFYSPLLLESAFLAVLLACARQDGLTRAAIRRSTAHAKEFPRSVGERKAGRNCHFLQVREEVWEVSHRRTRIERIRLPQNCACVRSSAARPLLLWKDSGYDNAQPTAHWSPVRTGGPTAQRSPEAYRLLAEPHYLGDLKV